MIGDTLPLGIMAFIVGEPGAGVYAVKVCMGAGGATRTDWLTRRCPDTDTQLIVGEEARICGFATGVGTST